MTDGTISDHYNIVKEFLLTMVHCMWYLDNQLQSHIFRMELALVVHRERQLQVIVSTAMINFKWVYSK